MNDTIGQDADVRFLEGVDRLTAPHAARKEGVDRTRDRLENGIVVAHVLRFGGEEREAGGIKIRASPRFVTARPASRAPRLLLVLRLFAMLDDVAGLEEDVLKNLAP